MGQTKASMSIPFFDSGIPGLKNLRVARILYSTLPYMDNRITQLFGRYIRHVRFATLNVSIFQIFTFDLKKLYKIVAK